MATLFDPLADASSASEEVFFTSRKREITNILKSYVGFYDPFAELIQNAMDAVEARLKLEDEGSKYKPQIWIDVNLKTNEFCITDNGTGFDEAKFRRFLAPNITFKQGHGSRGKKGVGATYLAYGFNDLQLGTRTPDYEAVADFKNGRNWVEDTEGVIDRPTAVESTSTHAAFQNIDRGSTFVLRFSGDTVRPKDLAWVGATTADQWASILQLKTPLGHIDFLDNDRLVQFHLRVTDSQGKVTSCTNRDAEYTFPHTVITSVGSISEIVAYQEQRIKNHQDPAKLPDRFKNLNGAWITWNNERVISALKGEQAFIDLASKYRITSYGFFSYSTKVWDAYNDNTLGLRKGLRILRGGLQLATDNMPQGDLLVIPLTSNIGYQNQSHIIVHFDGADPDLGRKGFQPELRDLAERVSVLMVGELKKWRNVLRADTGARPSIVDQGKLHDWITNQEQHEQSRPLIITTEHFFKPIHEASITSEPLSEQDAIVLFNQLIAGGVIRGVRLLATSQHQQYDSIFRYVVTEPLENHIFSKETNPLGVQDMQHTGPFTSKPFVLEYKYNVDALIQEFENETKNERDIDMVVAWTIGEEWSKRYNVTSLLDLNNLQHREFHGQTHVFRNAHTGDVQFYAIILDQLVEYLANVDDVQQKHRDLFEEL